MMNFNTWWPKTNWPGLFLALTFLSSSLLEALAQVPLRPVLWTDLQAQSAYDMKMARAWKVPADLGFEIEGEPILEGDLVRLAGWLRNSSEAPQLAVLFPVGALGFHLSAPHCKARPNTGPPLPVPAPPAPLALTLPAHSRFRVESTVSLSNCDWEQGSTRELSWSLLLWNEPKPHGTALIP